MKDNGPKLPPHDIDAERAILGAILLDEIRISDARDIIDERDFYVSAHQTILHAMCQLSDQNKPIDQVTLCDQLQQNGALEKVGGGAFIAELWAAIPSASNLVTHCELVRDHARRRRLTVVAQGLVDRGYQHQEPIEDLIDEAERELFALGHCVNGGGFKSIGELSMQRLNHLETLSKRRGEIAGLPTGFGALDRLTAGFQPEDLIVIGARPSHGKTAFSIAVARHAAIDLGRPVAIFSLEMSDGSLTDRILAAEARVDAQAIRTGQLTPAEWARLAMAAQRVDRSPLYIDDTPVVSMAQLRSKARRVKAQRGCELIIVDYLGLMQLPKGAESRQQAIADVSRDLKLLARELRLPVICLAQLNRNLESREDRRPLLSDLRDSGAIEQDADLTMFVYRDELYFPDSPDRGTAEILIRKHRNGPIGEVRIAFIERYALFSEIAVVGKGLC